MNLSLENNSKYTGETFHVSNGGIVISTITNSIFLGTTVWQTFVIIKLIQKYRYKLEPFHISELSILLDLISYKIFSFYGLGRLEMFLSDYQVYCFIVNFVQYFSRFSFYADSCASQVNMFLMIHLDIHYKEYVTTKHALVASVILKLVMMILCGVFAAVDPNYLSCSNYSMGVCSYLQINNIFWATIPLSIAILVILGLTLKVAMIIIQSESRNQVHPMPTISGTLNNINNTNSNHLKNISRKILSVNITTILIMGMTIPTNIINVYIYITKETCLTNENLWTYGKIPTLMTLASSLVMFYVSEKKLDKFN